jgi:PPOX class probable F420-dependent enzyme
VSLDRLRLRLRLSGLVRFLRSRFGVRRLSVKICRLQRRLRRIGFSAFRGFLPALQAVAHPFAHVWLVTYWPSRKQWSASQTNQDWQPQACVVRALWEKRGAEKRVSPITMSNVMANLIPPEISGQKYISLATFRKNGAAIRTPVWFGEEVDKLYVMTRSDMGKCKRIRNNPQVMVAPCTMSGKIIGPDFRATARLLAPDEFAHARQAINRKYWMARLPLIWRRTDAYLEISFAA